MTRASRGDPRMSRVALYWFNLGVVLEDLGRVAESIAAYERALAIEALMADAHPTSRARSRTSRSGPATRSCSVARHLKQYRELSRASGERERE